jgi:N-acetyl-anhydromuramyl-L-alanine amidase AmpD
MFKILLQILEYIFKNLTVPKIEAPPAIEPPKPLPVVDTPPPVVIDAPKVEVAPVVTAPVVDVELQKKLGELRLKKEAEAVRSSPTPIPAAKQVVGDIAHKTLTTLSVTHKAPELWIPFAERLGAPYAAATQGFYPRGYPQGMIQHYAGSRFHTRQDALNVLEYATTQAYSFLLIDGLGNLYQTAPLNRWGWHSGKSIWPGLGQYVHQWLVGLEVSNAGLLVEHNGKYFTEWGEEIPANEVRHVPTHIGNMTPGYYHKFSDAQIAMIEKTVRWLKENGNGIFKYELCLGHDEVSPGRKQDPGGSLPYTMKEYRQRLMDGRSLK